MPQPKLRVSSPSDAREREADAVAARAVSGSRAGGSVPVVGAEPVASEEPQRAPDEEQDVQRQVGAADEDQDVQRQAAEPAQDEVQRQAGAPDEDEVQRRAVDGGGAPRVTPRTAATVAGPGVGSPMPRSVRRSIEPHLGVGLDGVRVHTGADAAHAATSLRARAFTVGNDVYLNRGESPHDVSLMAHEATHVLQQGAAGRGPGQADRQVDEVQRLPDFITDKLADYAQHIPGYPLFTVIIGYDPLRGSDVERNANNLVRGLISLVPAGTFIYDKLQELGVLQPAFEFIEGQLATFDLSLSRLERTLEEAWDETDFIRLDPIDYNIGVLKRHGKALLDDVIGFATSVVSAVMDLIKEALIGVAEGLLAENRAWDLIKKILHWDPLRGVEVEASTVEILEDFLLLIGKQQELEQMRVRGTLQKTADWLDTQFATFSGLLAQLTSLFSKAWEAIQPENLPDLGSNLAELVEQAGAFLQQVWDFASTVASEVIHLIKDALLGWLSSFVDQVPGFHLLTVILGRNPFTGERVPRTPVTIMRGFITLLPGGNLVYAQLEETGVIASVGARIESALGDLGLTWEYIVGMFTAIWDTIVTIDSLIDPVGVFTQIRDRFGEPISRIFRFLRTVLGALFELLLALMNFPTDLVGRIVTNAMQAFEQIMADPIGFLLNMLGALRLGFTRFFDNILTHLMGGLADWLFRGLRDAGIEPPQDLSLASILDTVLQVLGISIERLWEKLAERFGQETIDKIRGVIDQVVGIWTVVRDVSERGVVALWEYVEGQLSNLWQIVLDAATEWIMEKVITAVLGKLMSFLDPTGIMAVINGFIAFFNAVQSAIEYLREILEIVDSYVATIAAVAAGDLDPAATSMEEGLAAAIPVAIGFLANQVGLGNIGEKIGEIMGQIRDVVDAALDWLLDRMEEMFQRVLALVRGGTAEQIEEDTGALGEVAEEEVAGEGDEFELHETIEIDDQDHELRNQPDSYELVVSSDNPSLLSNHPAKSVREAYEDYLAAIAAATSKTARKKEASKHARTIVKKLKAAGDPDAPRASAPGIGTVAPHSAQQVRLAKAKIPAWVMESEHVIPRGFVDATLTGVGEEGVPAAQTEYNAMHTILIYKGAADRKTEGDEGDVSLWRELHGRVREASQAAQNEPDPRSAMATLGAMVNGLLGEFLRSALLRTYVAIIEENEENGDLRGPEGEPEPPTPGKSKVDDAYLQQLNDIQDVIEKRMESP